jgi:hypothetical protein
MATATATVDSLPLPIARSRETESAVPWFVWTALLAVISGIVGGHWDISWHRSIGRDTFWSPPHIAIYMKGVLAGITFGYLILHTTFAKRDVEDVVSIWGLRGPFGAFIAAWGGITMLTSGPFDDWWHNAYGLDTKIVSPPHILLAIGSYAITFGTVVLVQALRSRSGEARQRTLQVVFLALAGCVVVEVMVLHIEAVFLVYQHTAGMYRTLALFVPGVLCAFSVASGHRWACTIAAGIYTAALLAFTWILPLVPAEPKLGPVYQHVTNLVPNGFPLLLIVPALAIDLIRARMPVQRRWLASLVLGVAFVALLFAVQWPFANFLQSPAARNWVFGSHYFAYMLAPTSFSARHLFLPDPSAAVFWRGLALAFVLAPLSARLGLSIGEWLARIRR